MHRIRQIALMTLLITFWAHLSAQAGTIHSAQANNNLIREIRHELVALPFYDVFDWLEGELRPDGTVILRGEVLRPTCCLSKRQE